MNLTCTPDPEPRLVVKTARAAYEWSQADLAREASVATSTIRRLERGQRPSVKTALSVADAIGVDVALLIPASPDGPQEGPGTPTPSPPNESEASLATHSTDRPERSGPVIQQ